LDLSFGYTPQQFEKINLLGSGLSEQAISSLVLSVQNVTYLDLRGNNLNAAFGWRLVKAMKRRYLKLEYCNGVFTRGLSNDEIDQLNLASFDGHHGLYGIEVVGAIFLAHFLRLNKSLTFLNFSRNDVQKDGAKALAQSLLGNPACNLRTVNGMGASLCPSPNRGGKGGIDFGEFRSGNLVTVNLSRRMLDDDDFVFLEEWLRRYDCVRTLDISHNLIGQPRWDGTGYTRDGIRKLTRHIKDTKTLTTLHCVGLPVDLEGTALLARAVVDSLTLETVSLPLGPCTEKPEIQTVLHQLGVGIAQHPTVKQFGVLDNRRLYTEIRSQQLQELAVDSLIQRWPRSETAVYLWATAHLRPPLHTLKFGNGSSAPLQEYPEITMAPPELFPPLIGIVHDARTLQKVVIAIPKDFGPLMVDLMRALARSNNSLKHLQLLGYAGSKMKDSQLPPDWCSYGPVPRWLLDDRVRQIKNHWLALSGLLANLPHLVTFNGINVEGSTREHPDRVTELLCQCLEGVAAEFSRDAGIGAELRLVARLNKDADVDAFCDVMRIMSRSQMNVTIELTFTGKNVERVKAQMFRLKDPLSGVPAGESGPRFTHAVELKNDFVSEALLKNLDRNAPLREFCYERLEATLSALFHALCSSDKPLGVERIRIAPKWDINPRLVGKRIDESQRRYLEGIHAALMRSDRFQEIRSPVQQATRDDLKRLDAKEFAMLMTGLSVESPQPQEMCPPMTSWRAFSSYRNYTEQMEDQDQPNQENPPQYVSLPMEPDMKDSAKKLSLCMCNLREHIKLVARPDEWAAPSKPLWAGPLRLRRPGDWNEFDQITPEEEYAEDDDSVATRYHWNRDLRIGTGQTSTMSSSMADPRAESFQDQLLSQSLLSVAQDCPALTSLDLRGNGLTVEDANVLLQMVETSSSIEYLNNIPMTLDEASSCRVLELDGTGIAKNQKGAAAAGKPADPFGDDDDQEPDGEWIAQQAIEADYVRLDEGDGHIFLSLVSPTNFKDLQAVIIKRHEIPSNTLHAITDALINVGSINRLQLSDLKLTGVGANLLVGAITEMAPRLVSLNHLPLKRLLQAREAAEHNPFELSGPIEWNDFTLGVMHKLQLWSVATWAPDHGDSLNEFMLQGKTITDVGLRGLCVMLRHFVQERPERSMGRGMLNLTQINLAGNNQITDGPISELCQTLLHPTGGALRHSLRDLNLRSCLRLRARSAHELLQLIQRLREAAHASGSQTAALGSSLQMLNGVDLAALQAFIRSSGGSSRSAPPMLIRSFVENSRVPHTINHGRLSECDVHYFAGILHLFPSIPYCHLHIVIPGDSSGRSDIGEADFWGNPNEGDQPPAQVSNQSPFPAPFTAVPASMAKAIQAHLDLGKKLLETCPYSTQLRISVAPLIPGVEDILAAGDTSVLSQATSGSGPSLGIFAAAQKRLVERAQRAKKKGRPKDEPAPPKKNLYVNNINSQRVHDCFRSLYGQDDVDLEHEDILASGSSDVRLPPEVDVTQAFEVASSLDMQHLDLGRTHLANLKFVEDMHALTHLNLNNNLVGDSGVEILFDSLAKANSTLVHVSLSSNNIGDVGAETIANTLPNLPRLTSLELCDNFIQERGSVAIAEAVGQVPPNDEQIEEQPALPPLPLLSIDLRGNKTRYIGAMRWAEVIVSHPKLQFLCLAQNELGMMNSDSFMALVYAAVASVALSVLDLRDNFQAGPGGGTTGPPPERVLQELLSDLPQGEFDENDVKQAVFIRRQRSGGDRKGRQPQQAHGGSRQH
jgi:hypothetical protein